MLLFIIRMPLTKQCTLCGAIVHVKKSVCVCGRNFILKRKAVATGIRSTKAVMKQLRASECVAEIAFRRMKDSASKSKKRALETDDECIHRKEQDIAYKGKKGT